MKILTKPKAIQQLNDVLHTLKPMLTDDIVTRIHDFIEINSVTYEAEDIANRSFLEFGAAYYPNETNVDEATRYPVYEFSLCHEGEPVINVILKIAPSEDGSYITVTAIEVTEV